MGYVTVRPKVGEQMPPLIDKSRLAVEQEAAALGPRIEKIFTTRDKTSPAAGDEVAWKAVAKEHKAARRRLCYIGTDQARLIYSNGYDHLVTLGRILGGDGRAALFAHTTLARSVAEAAVRVAWLLDADVTYGQRIVRSAALIYDGAMNRAKGAREIPERGDRLSGQRPQLVANCENTVQLVEKVIMSAGITIEANDRKKPVRLRLGAEVVPMNFETGPLMRKLLPEFPSLYTVTSAVAHSTTWILDESRENHGPDLELSLDQMQLGAAAQASIAASALIVKTYARHYGHDPEPLVRESRQRVAMVDGWMRQYAGELELIRMQAAIPQRR